MTRHAVEDHLQPAPVITDPNDDRHPFNRGVIFSDVGSLTVFMFFDNPGIFFLDLHGQQPATDAQAVTAFGVEAFARYRAMGVEHDDDARIEAALAATAEPTPEEVAREDLKAKARRLIREQQKLTQAAADKQRTAWLDHETPAA
jgi:hypothetical protein